MVPSLPGVFVPSVTTSPNVVHSSYVPPPRITSERFVVDECVTVEGTIQREVGDAKQAELNSPGRSEGHEQQRLEQNTVAGANVSSCTRFQPHLATLQATMQPYYLQGSPTGAFLYMQPAVFSPPPQVFDPYGRPSASPAAAVYRPPPPAPPPQQQQQQQQPSPLPPPALQQQQQPHQAEPNSSLLIPDLQVKDLEQVFLCNDPINPESIDSTKLDSSSVEILKKTDPKKIELSSTESIACQKHEHLCCHTEVVVKLPAKKKTGSERNTDSNISNGQERQRPNDPGFPAHVAQERILEENRSTANEPEHSSCSTDSNLRTGAVNVDSASVASKLMLSQPPPSSASNQSRNKSWASLFNSVEDKIRPMARVSPRIKTNSPLVDVNYKISTSQSTSCNTKNRVSLSCSGESGSDSYLKRLGEFLRTYEPDHKIVSLQPRGLTNRNNWCYVNAILQSLIACPPFYNLIKAVPVTTRRHYAETLILENLYDFVQEFLPANARIGKREKSARNRDGEMTTVEVFTGAAFEPSAIYKILDKLRGENCFDIEGRQEDAEEFLSCLLNGLNDEMFELIKAVKKPSTTNDQDEITEDDGSLAAGVAKESSDTDADTAAWTVMGPKNKSSVTRRAVCGKTPISDIFRGQTRCRVLKAGDQTPTDNVQPFFTLQLDIEKAASVKEALELLVGKDELQGVTCSKTHKQVEAWTQTTLEDLPIVLILHLKCFLYKPDGCSKIVKTLDFPVDLKIDIKLMSANRKNKYSLKQRSYKLIAVVYHDGKEATKGHYVTDAYHVGYGCWIRYDDGAVRSVPESHVLRPRPPRVPYLLYYRRGDTVGTTK